MAHTASDFNVINATPKDIDELNLALSYLDKSSTASSMLDQAKSNGVSINIIHDGGDLYRLSTNTINWDPNSGLLVKVPETDIQTTAGVQSAALGLIHEVAHALDPNLRGNASNPTDDYGNRAEQVAVEQEDKIADELGEVKRYNHGGDPIVEQNSTEHTTQNSDGTFSWAQQEPDGTVTLFGSFKQGSYPDTAPTPSDGEPTQPSPDPTPTQPAPDPTPTQPAPDPIAPGEGDPGEGGDPGGGDVGGGGEESVEKYATTSLQHDQAADRKLASPEHGSSTVASPVAGSSHHGTTLQAIQLTSAIASFSPAPGGDTGQSAGQTETRTTLTVDPTRTPLHQAERHVS